MEQKITSFEQLYNTYKKGQQTIKNATQQLFNQRADIQQAKTKETFTTSSKKFKLVIYYSHRQDGTPYSIGEIKAKFNRKYTDSYDYETGAGGKTRTNHYLAVKKLLNYVEQNKANIYKALLIVNDWEKNQEHTIGVFPRGSIELGNFIEPLWNKDDKGNILYNGLPLLPLRTDVMRKENVPMTLQVKENEPKHFTTKNY